MSDAFDCVLRPRPFWTRFADSVFGRVGGKRHEPDRSRLSTRQVEWAEFRGRRFTHQAAPCIHCGEPLVLHPAGVWQVRVSDDAFVIGVAADSGNPQKENTQ